MKKIVIFGIVFVLFLGLMETPFVAVYQVASHPVETVSDFLGGLLGFDVLDDLLEDLEDFDTDDLAEIYYLNVEGIKDVIDTVVTEYDTVYNVTEVKLSKIFMFLEYEEIDIDDARLLSNYISDNMPDEMDYKALIDWLLETEPFASQAKNKEISKDDLALYYGLTSYSSTDKVDISTVSGIGNKIVAIAKSKLDCPYYWGKTGPDYFDCSGLVYYCLTNAGVSTSRLTASGYSKSFTTISYSSLHPGDLITFSYNNGKTVSHIGIYVGNGQMIHASGEGSTCKGNHVSRGHVVKYGNVSKGSYYYNHIYNCKRVYSS
ncbi:MAG: NlpC/P60 family protein [Erysipelotrichaceae bacterium]|nr:NlpC/P60 family protein [Erysipelotrichaceae bacterium]